METAAQRFARDWAQQKGDRKARGLDAQDVNRRKRIYVDSATGTTPAAP